MKKTCSIIGSGLAATVNFCGFRHVLSLAFVGAMLGAGDADAGLKIYYIRHAEGGHNVKKAWEAKNVPQSEWPSYVGNPDVFTPKGEQEVIAATEKLKAYPFDFIASSPIWRARNTILPYLKDMGQPAEVWPELREGPGMVTILSKDIPDLNEDILNQGEPILLPEEEQAFFSLRDEATNHYSKPPRGSDENVKVAYMKHASLHAIDVIKKRFGGTEQSILLAGHNSSGVSLLKLLLQGEPENKRGLSNTGIWMVEEQSDGTFVLKIYNDKPVDSDVDTPEEHPAGETNVRFKNLRGDLSGGEIDGLRSSHSNVAITNAVDGKDVMYSFSIENKNLDDLYDKERP